MGTVKKMLNNREVKTYIVKITKKPYINYPHYSINYDSVRKTKGEPDLFSSSVLTVLDRKSLDSLKEGDLISTIYE